MPAQVLAQRPDLLATSWRPPGAAALQKLSEEQRTEQLNAALRAVVLLPPTTRWADRLSLAVVPAAADVVRVDLAARVVDLHPDLGAAGLRGAHRQRRQQYLPGDHVL